MTTNSFREFLKGKAEETGILDLGESAVIHGNIPGVIIGAKGNKRWVKPNIKGMQAQLVDPKDIVYDDSEMREKNFKAWLKKQKE